MKPIINQTVSVERLTREPDHYFFGYYDNQPFSADNEYHLAHRIKFMNRMQTGSDMAELGMIRLRDNAWIPVAETYAWNFQQGSMYQWRAGHPDEVVYNVLYGGQYKSVVQNIRIGETRILPRALANISPDGRFGLAVNFPRIYWFRPGYGYAGLPDPWAGDNHPADDGVYLVDLDSGEDKMVISLDDLYRIAEPYFQSENEKNFKFVVNHINFNTDGSRFLMLFRGKRDGMPGWCTYTITANADGSDPYLLLEDFSSHYHWFDPNHVAIYSKTFKAHEFGLWMYTDRTHEARLVEPRLTMPTDGHLSFSPDRRYMLNDTYPQNGYRKLFLYDIARDKTVKLGEFLVRPTTDYMANGDMRCDLHPRWNRDGSMISFDSIHEGHRHIYKIDVEDINWDKEF